LVEGWRFAAGFLGSGLCVVLLACDFDAAFLRTVGFFEAGAAAPDETRDECFARCFVVFFGVEASAIEESANAAISAATSSLIAFLAMQLR
jgi:hypothetical protein